MLLSAVEALFALIDPERWVTLDLPAPPSVNKVRRFNFAQMPALKQWKAAADSCVLAAKRRRENPLRLTRIPTFEIHITLSEAHTGIDLDNAVKSTVDFLVERQVIAGDGPKHMRRVVVEWGHAPEGCRVQVRPWEWLA